MKRVFYLLLFAIFISPSGIAQNYQALHGNYYANGLTVYNNPASIVNTMYPWDLTLFALQVKNSTNFFKVRNYSLISKASNVFVTFNEGTKKRFNKFNFNLNLLNARFALTRKSSIAFGANIKAYANFNVGKYKFIDSLKTIGDFFTLNSNNVTINGYILSSSWLETFLTYSRTIADNQYRRINAGITLKASKGVAGAYTNLYSGPFSAVAVEKNKPVYKIDNVSLHYGYSSNLDSGRSKTATDYLIANTDGGGSFDVGVEYLIKPQGTTDFYDEEEYYDYDWKIGLSLLDVGANQYRYGVNSHRFEGIKSDITDRTLDTKLASIEPSKKFNDSLSSITNSSSPLNGKFWVINPIRAVINVDHYIDKDFYINAELVINVPKSILKKYLRIQELNHLTITPRWETKRLAAYLPIQFNNNKQLWIGAAAKAGPLLIGLHNLGYIFSKKSMQNGGGYLAFIFHVNSTTKPKKIRELDCLDKIW